MPMEPHDPLTRRAFLSRGLTLASIAATAPYFVQNSAVALAQAAGGASSVAGVPEDRILVVVQLGGGNDGLNTVIPAGFAEYQRARPAIAIREREALSLGRGEEVSLHPALAGLKSLHDDGLLSIVQGVGYPNPNRSHFLSMDIWHTAKEEGVGTGWLGRYIDNECAGRPECEGGVAMGRTAPLALEGRKVKPVAFDTPDLFRWTGQDLHDSLEGPYRAMLEQSGRAAQAADDGSNLSFLMRTAMDAQVSSDQIRAAVRATPLVNYPRTDLARQLMTVGAMIRAGLRTRVYYVSMGGFDTHSGQGGAQGRHAQLLTEYGDALLAFTQDLRAQGNDGRVLTMTFSEFGRRVGQNGSNGTDHGAAAPMFLTGPMVRPGVATKHPSMTDLEDGDLRFGTDFREVYAAVLADWMGADPESVIGKGHRPAKVIRPLV